MIATSKLVLLSAIALAFVASASCADMDIIDQMSRTQDVAHRLKMAIKAVKQLEASPIQETVRTNFLTSLYLMANASAVAGTNVSRAASTVIRGFVQDSFNLGSIGVYLPRLVFLDGPTQFIETLRLVRTNQLQIPRDVDSAMDTLINFATHVRDSQVAGNINTPFLSFFPNIFGGAETLAGDVLYNVFAWLSPINPGDISLGATNTLANRWDSKVSTTGRTRVAGE